MRATGVIRRVDDLGRIVIPKEIRQTLKIREGDPLEIWLDGSAICLKKYDVIAPFEDTLKSLVDMLNDEDVSRKISEEDKSVIRSIVNMLLVKCKDAEGEEK